MHRITRAEAKSDFTVQVEFEDGRTANLELAEMVRTAAIASPFRDPDRFVSALHLIEDGEVLRWDEQFELHADSVRYRAFPDELTADYGPEILREGRTAA